MDDEDVAPVHIINHQNHDAATKLSSSSLSDDGMIPSPPTILLDDNKNDTVPRSSLPHQEQPQELPPFVPEQRVLCQDKGMLYEAVIRQSQFGIVAPNCKKQNIHNNQHHHVMSSSPSQLQQHPQPQWSYLVHFLGWNSRYDKWVKRDDIFPDTEEHRARFHHQQQQKKQQQQQQTLPLAAANSSTTPTTNVSMVAAAKSNAKRKVTDLSLLPKKQQRRTFVSPLQQQQSSFNNAIPSCGGGQPQVLTCDYCELPFTLQTVLVDEWEHITRTNNYYNFCCAIPEQQRHHHWRPIRRVHHLPATMTIRQVLQYFIKFQSSTNHLEASSSCNNAKQQQQLPLPPSTESASSNRDTNILDDQPDGQNQLKLQQDRRLNNFVQDLLKLVEEALPVCLLYPQERPQWELLKAAANRDKAMLLSSLSDPSLSSSNTFSPCDMYGAEFLLRLVVRLPLLMPTVPKDVGQLIAELVVMLQKNHHVCFKGSYREPLPNELLEWELERMTIE